MTLIELSSHWWKLIVEAFVRITIERVAVEALMIMMTTEVLVADAVAADGRDAP